MKSTSIPFSDIESFSFKDKSYTLEPEKFSEFISYLPTEEGLLKAIEDRKEFPVNRALLTTVIGRQYSILEMTEGQKANLEALSSENTYTVITAHQPSLFTGPLYYIYKICSIIKLAERLNAKGGDFKVVPVFINGSEDHDFEEINHLHLFGKKIEWQNEEGGAVGRKSITGLKEALVQFQEILGQSADAIEICEGFYKAIESKSCYNDAVFVWTNELFAKHGLLVVQTDDEDLKKAFVPVMEKELIEQSSEKLILQTQKKLEALGFKMQAFPREINLFYLSDGSRERITFQSGIYRVNNTDIEWTKDDIITHLHSFPARFSPNVNLRPLYQEVIFPNIAYIGGGGEIAYWLERKSQFQHFEVFFPALVRRKSMILLPSNLQKGMDKLNLTIQNFLPGEEVIISAYLKNATAIDISLEDEMEMINQQLTTIEEKSTAIDQTLQGFVAAEKTRILKQLEQIESRIKRSLKKQEETQVNQIKNIRSKLFPGGGLQERTDNYFQYRILMGEGLMDVILDNADPMNREVALIMD